MTLKLSILDQSPISEGQTAHEALKDTVELAKWADQAGFERFWVSEHHDTDTLAGSTPEILVSHIAGMTESIKVGSGGVMLPHYSSYKVAENFKLLEALFPGRIDVGLGRAPGGMPRATRALQDGAVRDIHQYPQQIDELAAYLHDALPENHPLYGLKATPISDTVPEMWLLGSSSSSASLAAEKGLPYTFALFINGEGGESYVRHYHEQFQPSPYFEKPKSIVAVFAVCAKTEEKANYIAGSLDLTLLRLEQGMSSKGTPHPDKYVQYRLGQFEKARVDFNRQRMVVGSPSQVKEQLERLSDRYQTDEIMLTTIAFNFIDKIESFKLIANEIL